MLGARTRDPIPRTTSGSPQPPRPSTSSNRSVRKTEADFEAALLSPNATIYLSGSPTIGEEDSAFFSIPGANGLGPSSAQSPRLQQELGLDADADTDAPLPVEKRSFEDDLNDVGVGEGRKRSITDGRMDLGKGRAMTSIRMPDSNYTFDAASGSSAAGAGAGVGVGMGVGVIPPTPTNKGSRHSRRASQITNASNTSGGTGTGTGVGDTPTRGGRRTSLGIDAEIAAEINTKTKTTHSKRRSIFRSPGTASSPDLATLVRKAKEAKAAPHTQQPTMSTPTSTPPPSRVLQKTNPSRAAPPPPSAYSRTDGLSPRPSPSPVPEPVPGNGGTPSRSASSSSQSRSQSRERSRIASGAQEETMERYGRMLGGNQMASIAEGSRPGGRNRQSSHDDGFKSMRNKAKGVFGKMFGSGSTREHSPLTSPSIASSSRFFDHAESSRPPVPPVPSAYARDNDAHRTFTLTPQSTDVFGQELDSSGQMRTPSTSQYASVATPATDGRASATPTGQRQVSNGSHFSLDKPLPAVHGDDEASSRRRSVSTPQRGSMHIRQPASTVQDEDSPPQAESSRRASRTPSPRARPEAITSFTDDVAGMLASIGQSDPARELGLPPDSLRRKDKERTTSMETARESRSRFPNDLGRSASAVEGSNYLLSPILSPRASSLPSASQQNPPPAIPQRTASSPNPSLQGETTSAPAPAPAIVSRSSSRSSTKRSAEGRSTVPPPLASPVPVSVQAPSMAGTASNRSDDLSPLLPQSIKLVSPPQFDEHDPLDLTSDALAKSSFINTSPWGRQSRPNSQDVDQMEMVNSAPVTPSKNGTGTLGGEEDEERGRRLACEFLEGDASSVPTDKVAEFLGGPRPVNGIALRYYMQYFDMKGQNLVDAFRDLCQKLHLKAESQEIDRIIEGFSARFYDCNPSTVFGSPGVVHTVTAAMLMLNTDLHIADLNKHMSRSDFVRNAMRAIHESMPMNDRSSTPDLVRDDSSSSVKAGFGSTASMAPSFVSMRSKPPLNPQLQSAQRSASAPVVNSSLPPGPSRTDSTNSISTNNGNGGLDGKTRGSSTTVSSFTYGKAWEAEAEAALREIYSSVRNDKILLPISGAGTPGGGNNRQSMISISSNGPYDRARAVRSPSDRLTALKRGSIRGVQGLLNNPYGSQWSASDGRLSPTPSYATSINEGFGSFAPTLGFASNLSHTVIKEQDDELRSLDSRASTSTTEDMDDDELALLGAPWAKEGLLSRKLYWESVGKRAKKTDWKQFFVVISKGELYMFTFGEKGGGGFGGSVGGGNWLENANAVGTISLMHTMTMALPKPGYNANRPYCFSVALPSGETSFFQAGTEDLVGEWVATCNYWAARRSRQPLQGGVSNMEYGWNRALPLPSSPENPTDPAENADDRASIKSGRSNLSRLGGGGSYGRKTFGSAGGGRGMNDRIHINDWKPPMPATMPSPLDEEAQLDALQAYVRSLVQELEEHKAVEEGMNRLYSPGSKNLHKAKENYKAKSHYIHTEIYKYETYVESLRNAISLRVKKQGEKKLEKSLARSMTSLHRAASSVADGDEAGEEGFGRRGGEEAEEEKTGHESGPREEGRTTPVAPRDREGDGTIRR